MLCKHSKLHAALHRHQGFQMWHGRAWQVLQMAMSRTCLAVLLSKGAEGS